MPLVIPLLKLYAILIHTNSNECIQTAMTEENKLELQIGDTLQLQFVADEAKRRNYSKVIGYLQGHSVLITTPRIEGNIMLIREDQIVIVRMLAGNRVYGFTTKVMRSCLKPYPYLHLAYPAEMEQITVRKAQRVSTQLIVSVERETADTSDIASCSAVVIDISTTGAMVETNEFLGRIGDIVSIKAKITVGSVQEYIAIPCIIRNIRDLASEAKNKMLYGMEFQLLEQHEHFVLHGFVYEQMIQNMKR